MITRSLLTFALTLCSVVTLLPSGASAQTPLNRATIQNLRNKVDLTAKQQTRPAQKADIMTPGDALRTYRAAMAELRFNDKSLARIGEQALFQFVPNSRNFELQQGTVLLFITPGQGRTRVRTPNAAAGIRGSALFVRYIPDSKVTLIGALTNSDIEVSNGDSCNNSQSIALKAGQLGYVFNCQIGVYNFNLKKFQETSPLFKDANLEQNPEVSAEISQALAEQGTFAGNSESNPDWTKIAENRQAAPVASGPGLNNLAFERPAVEANQIKPELPSRPDNNGRMTPPPEPIVTPVAPSPPQANPPSVATQPPPASPGIAPPASNPPRPLPDVQLQTPPAPIVTPVTPPSPPISTVPTPPSTPPATPTTPTVPAAPTPPTVPTPPVATVTPPTPPVTPATPAVPNPGNGPATPAVPASPAATPPVVSPPSTPTVVTSPPVTTPTPTVTTPTVTVTTPAATPVVDTPVVQPAPAAPTTTTTPTTPTTTPAATGAGGQTSANTTRPVPIVQPSSQ